MGKRITTDSMDGSWKLVPSPTDGVQHPVNPDVIADTNVGHILRGNKDILLVGVGIGRVDLGGQASVRLLKERGKERRALTIIFILMRRFTASMKTSNSSIVMRVR